MRERASRRPCEDALDHDSLLGEQPIAARKPRGGHPHPRVLLGSVGPATARSLARDLACAIGLGACLLSILLGSAHDRGRLGVRVLLYLSDDIRE